MSLLFVLHAACLLSWTRPFLFRVFSRHTLGFHNSKLFIQPCLFNIVCSQLFILYSLFNTVYAYSLVKCEDFSKYCFPRSSYIRRSYLSTALFFPLSTYFVVRCLAYEHVPEHSFHTPDFVRIFNFQSIYFVLKC